MFWHTKGIKETLELLRTNTLGLTEEEVEKRLKKYGPNILVEKKKRSLLSIFIYQFKNFLTILLVVAFIISIFTQPLSHSIVLLVVILVNVFMGFSLEYKAERALESLKKIFTRKIVVRRDGSEMIIPVKKLVKGDIVVLSQGDLIAADLRLLSYNNLKIDESSLTGESIPSRKTTKIIAKEAVVADQENMAFAGTTVVDGTGEGVVVKTSSRTELGKIAKTVEEEAIKTPLQKRLDFLGKILIGLSFIGVLIIFVAGILRGEEILPLFNFAIALLVSIVPESLPTIVILALALGVIRMAKKQAIVRRLPSVETLASVNVICSDKTGTLTKNQMTTKLLWTKEGGETKIPGSGFSPIPKINLHSKKALLIAKVSFLCNNSTLSLGKSKKDWQVIGDPTEGALKVFASKAGQQSELLKIPRVREIPFSEDRKRMSVVVEEGDGHGVYLKGAPEAVVECSNLREVEKEEILKKSRELAERGFRLLAFAHKIIKARNIGSLKDKEIETGLEFLGILGLIDPPSKSAKKAIADCAKAKIKVVVISGDHKLTTLSVAKELRLKDLSGKEITEKNVMTGEELQELTAEELSEKIDDIYVFARTEPLQKKKILSALKKKGHLVAMTGDGVNDAPALRRSDVSIAMGRRGQEVSKEISDIILLDDNFATIKAAIEYARSIYDNIKKFLTFLLSGNFDELFLVLIAFIFGLPLPFTALQILWINLITDSFPALALAFEGPSKDIMRQPPRDRKRSMIKDVVLYAVSIGSLATVLGLAVFLFYLSRGETKARTMVFSLAVFFELFIVFSIRAKHPFWSKEGRGFFSNKFLILAFFVSAILQIAAIYTPLSIPMGTVALNGFDWGVIILLCLMSFLVLEIVKSFRLRRKGAKV